MPLNESTGDMYNWVTHTHCHLRGECFHGCTYCYARKGRARKHYLGALRLAGHEFRVRYPAGATVFVGHMVDYFADGVPDEWIEGILIHLRRFPDTRFVIQTRNTRRLYAWKHKLPPEPRLGTTAESDVHYNCMNLSPYPTDRLRYIGKLREDGFETFVTVEPVMAFCGGFAALIEQARPNWVYVGADSKRCHLPEPAGADVRELVRDLQARGLTVILKPNIYRLWEAS